MNARSARIVTSYVSLATGLVLLAACTAGSGPVGGLGSATTSDGAKLGGLAKNTTCRNPDVSKPRSAMDQACDACAAEQCLTEARAVLGSDPNAFGGACADYQQCVCDCDGADQTCETGCEHLKSSAACDDALRVALGCLATNCKSSGC